MKNRRNLIIVVAAVIFLIGIGLYIRSRTKSAKDQSTGILDEAVIPTVDPSVKVDLQSTGKKGEVKLAIKNAPQGTNTIEYEITYDARTPASDESEGGVTPQ